MNAASIAMAASLFRDDKPMAPPAKASRSPVLLPAAKKKSSSDSFEDELPEESVASTVLVTDDKPEDLNDDDDSLGAEKVNGTGLIMYVTSTATKAPYWKRRLGWNPDMARAQRQKLKNLFRAPIRKQATVGISQNAHEGDALLFTKRIQDSNQLQSDVSDCDLVVPARESSSCKESNSKADDVMGGDDDQAKGREWHAFLAVNHELVFA